MYIYVHIRRLTYRPMYKYHYALMHILPCKCHGRVFECLISCCFLQKKVKMAEGKEHCEEKISFHPIVDKHTMQPICGQVYSENHY